MTILRSIPAFLFITAPSPVLADILVLSNGDTLSGVVVRANDQYLVWSSTLLGELTVAVDDVATVNGVSLADSLRSPEPSTAEPAVGGFAEAISAELDVAFEKDEGTSDSEEIEVRFKSSYDFGLTVGSLRLEHESTEERGVRTEEDYELELKAERYANTVNRGRYWYLRGDWNKDRFRTTEEWIAVGAGLGHVWQPAESTRIKLQGGIDAWSIALPDERRSAPGGRLLFDLRHTFQDFANLTAFSEAQFVWELGGRHNHIVETSSGLRLPISDFFYAQFSLDYDRFESPEAPDLAANDESEWNFRMGIQWD